MIKFTRSTKLISCASVQQSGRVPAARQMPSVALTHKLHFTSTTASQQLVFPLFLTGNGPRIRADWLQRASLPLHPPGKHPAASLMHVHVSQPVQRSPKLQPLSVRWRVISRPPPPNEIAAACGHTAEIITSLKIKSKESLMRGKQICHRAEQQRNGPERRSERPGHALLLEGNPTEEVLLHSKRLCSLKVEDVLCVCSSRSKHLSENITGLCLFSSCLAECQSSLGLSVIKGFISEVLLKMSDRNPSSLTTFIDPLSRKVLVEIAR